MSTPLVFHDVNSLTNHLDSFREKGKKIGFVPTMGALHEGHLSLLESCFRDCDICVISIFVNPRQFNDSKDFANYPRQISADLSTLSSYSNLVIFLPQENEIYNPNRIIPNINLGSLPNTMEGSSRPGHFKGVAQVVYLLFDIVKPNRAYFGMKDFQQLSIIKHLVKALNLPIEIIGCPTSREPSGLARSSRNQLLSSQQKKEAEVIYQVLLFIKNNVRIMNINNVLKGGLSLLNQSSLRLDYLTIVDPETLLPVEDFNGNGQCCIAVFCGDVRLIDNIELN